MTGTNDTNANSVLGRRKFIVLVSALPGIVGLSGCGRASLVEAGQGTATVLATAPSLSTQTGAPIDLPILIGGQIRRPGDKPVALPGTWAVSRIHRSSIGLLVDATETDERFVAVVGKDGAARRLSSVVPPLAVSPDGQLVAGLAPRPAAPGDGASPARSAVLVRLAADRVEHRLEVGSLTPELFLTPGQILLSSPSGDLRLWSPGAALTQLPIPAAYRPVGKTATGDVIAVTESGSVAAYSWPAGAQLWSRDRFAGVWPAVSRDGTRVAVLTPDNRLLLLRSRDGTVEAETACAPTEAPRLVWESADFVLIENSGPHRGAILRGSSTGCVVAAAEGGLLAS